tara:strand:- start:89 stop:415 length:327 start_codon:yes stop_codon:yes gene_type:complete
MARAFQVNHQLTPQDLSITIQDQNGLNFSPYAISYAFYGKGNGIPYRVGIGANLPSSEDEGVFYASNKISNSFLKGDYYCEWVIKRTEDSPSEIVARQEFTVYSEKSY